MMDNPTPRKVELAPQRGVYALSSFDILGDIAVVHIPKSLQNEARLIAEALMQRHSNQNCLEADWRSFRRFNKMLFLASPIP